MARDLSRLAGSLTGSTRRHNGLVVCRPASRTAVKKRCSVRVVRPSTQVSRALVGGGAGVLAGGGEGTGTGGGVAERERSRGNNTEKSAGRSLGAWCRQAPRISASDSGNRFQSW